MSDVLAKVGNLIDPADIELLTGSARGLQGHGLDKFLTKIDHADAIQRENFVKSQFRFGFGERYFRAKRDLWARQIGSAKNDLIK